MIYSLLILLFSSKKDISHHITVTQSNICTPCIILQQFQNFIEYEHNLHQLLQALTGLVVSYFSFHFCYC